MRNESRRIPRFDRRGASERSDQLRARYGRNVVYLGAAQEARESAPMRISFTHIPDMDLEGDD
ncbi:MAG: hypothetical protein K9N23_01330 [Akkermansiaceae bacterium]|nr:hypothetical protein [Akkermansiaceae bacterium]MCF7730292.1 hypothetical protein [Akkermansiaceae bacterium]